MAVLLLFAGVAVAHAADAPVGGGSFVQFVETSREAVPFGHPYAVQVAGNRAFVANGEGGLVILALGADGPKLLGRFITGNIGRDAIDRGWIHEYRGLATAIATSGRYVFLLTQSKGYDISLPKILRFDVANPTQPVAAGEGLLDHPVSDIVALDASRVCLLGGKSGEASIAIADFSDPGRERVTVTSGLPRLPRGGQGTREVHARPSRALARAATGDRDARKWLRGAPHLQPG